MKISTKGRRSPRTLSVKEYRAQGKPITEIAKIMGVSRQWVDFVLKRDGDTLPRELAIEATVDKPTLDKRIVPSIIK